MLRQLYKNIQKNMSNIADRVDTWNVPCLGGKFSVNQLRGMDSGIWQYITTEMLTYDLDFLLAFKDKAHWNLIQREADSKGLPAASLKFLNEFLDLKTVNYDHITKEFIELFRNRLDATRIQTQFPQWYSEIYNPDPEPVPASTSAVVVPVVRQVGIKGQVSKIQATEEERKQANIDHGIKDIVPHQDEKKRHLTDAEVEAGGFVKVVISRPKSVLNVDNTSRYAKYADILPNTFPAKMVVATVPLISHSLNHSRVWPLDGVWYPEDQVGDRIVFMLQQYQVSVDLIMANIDICIQNANYISRSKYLTEDVIMLLGPWLDWAAVSPTFYTPKIILQYGGQVNAKQVLVRTDASLYQNLPEIIAYKSRADAVIIEYLEQKLEIQEKMTRERFVQNRTDALSNRRGLEASFDEDYRNQMFGDDDNDDEPDDSLTLLARAHARLQNTQNQH